MRPVITLTTDFGNSDPSAGIMKGVILNIAPQAEIVDISHDIEPQNVRQAAYILQSAVSFFPKQSIHLVVVDPGVGGPRRAIAAKQGAHRFVAPDNGVLTGVLESNAQVYELNRDDYFLKPISATFHGRDIFSPIAAWLAKGVPLEKLGKKIFDPDILELPQPIAKKSKISGEIIYIDRFGNLGTNIPQDLMTNLFPQGFEDLQIELGSKNVGRMVDHYATCPEGKTAALVNSWNRLEIFCSQGDAAKKLKARPGMEVTLSKKRSSK